MVWSSSRVRDAAGHSLGQVWGSLPAGCSIPAFSCHWAQEGTPLFCFLWCASSNYYLFAQLGPLISSQNPLCFQRWRHHSIDIGTNWRIPNSSETGEKLDPVAVGKEDWLLCPIASPLSDVEPVGLCCRQGPKCLWPAPGACAAEHGELQDSQCNCGVLARLLIVLSSRAPSSRPPPLHILTAHPWASQHRLARTVEEGAGPGL